ncbi:protein SMG5 [Drosophila innubila]|uniref:protein SMG5 n=1 Tax=Drosophila innubila TaxID=198719 RepID=UPI00148D39CB|nr:protein SMG5 [Drosophila innubila]
MESTLSSGGSNASSECAADAGGGSGGGGGKSRCRNLESSLCGSGNHHNGSHSSNGNSALSLEVKDLYRALYTVSKQLDDAKRNVQNIGQLFQHEIEEKRANLVQLCKQIIFKDYQSVGKKVREVMWRRGYYEFIAFVKKHSHKHGTDPEHMQKLERFLCAGIFNYKRLSAKMEEIYDLDLKYLIDFSIISEGYISDFIGDSNVGKELEPSQAAVDKSLEAVSFALDTIHSSLLSLGDLHRYFLDFRIDSQLSLSISKEQVAKYYLEAFKLNPAIGMAQNQLGTLYYGQNYDLDSTYHYLYSLVCIIPFELSENNLNKLFAKHTEYLEQMDPGKLDFNIEDFYARFYLIVDIFFFDKEVPDFNSLCHCVLIDLRKILCAQMLRVPESSIFKIISILFFCLSKLKMINSPKVYSLHAFLVAACSDLMDACIVNIEQMILARAADNEHFQTEYEQRFQEFDTTVRKSRNEYKNWLAAVGECERKDKKMMARSHSLKDCSSDSRDSQHSADDGGVKTQDATDNDKLGGAEPISTRSSDEAKESDLKTPLSCKSKRRGMRLRRRRRKIAQSDDSSCYDSESDMDTDFYSDEEDYTDLSSNFDTDFSDIDAAEPDEAPNRDYTKKERTGRQQAGSNVYSDSEDVVIEEERLVYPDELERRPNSQEIDSEELLRSFEVLQMNFKSTEDPLATLSTRAAVPEASIGGVPVAPVTISEPPKKLVYRNKYTKINPNIIIDCLHNEATIRALKMLFDWLRINPEILIGCYHSNPEFVHKIMKLLNYCNIDVFTRKVYFERDLLTTSNVREALVELFDVRANVPLSEDFAFKNFDIFQSTQITLDWETIIRERVTPQEESILRIFKMVDFGFFICKQKKFNYRFCVKTRRFTENQKKKREEKKGGGSRRRERRTAPKTTRKRNEGRTRRYSDRKNGIVRKSYTSNEEKDTVEECRKLPRKGYLRNRNAEKAAAVIASATGTSVAGGTSASASTTTNSVIEKLNLQSSSGADEERSEAMSKKCEIMGKLWLQNEVETLEEELRDSPAHVVMSPFVVVDAKALTEYNGIVKSLVRTKKCIVLIPNAVLNELDELKKRSENVRHVIRWLEQEFKHGNRHLRAQRDNESQPLSLLKISRKMDRDASVFLQIAQFCNHLVANHADPHVSELQKNVVTYLSGDNLHEKNRQQQNFSYTGILDSIPVRYAQIQSFYAKFKANKK